MLKAQAGPDGSARQQMREPGAGLRHIRTKVKRHAPAPVALPAAGRQRTAVAAAVRTTVGSVPSSTASAADAAAAQAGRSVRGPGSAIDAGAAGKHVDADAAIAAVKQRRSSLEADVRTLGSVGSRCSAASADIAWLDRELLRQARFFTAAYCLSAPCTLPVFECDTAAALRPPSTSRVSTGSCCDRCAF